MKSLKPFVGVIVCIIASTTIYADVDLSGVAEVMRKTAANNDFVLPADSRFERKWQNFTKAASEDIKNEDVRHSIADAFVLIDNTVFGACDDGVLIDRLGITVQNDFSDTNGFISWTDFALNGIVSQDNDKLVLLKSPNIVADFSKSNFTVADARTLFVQLLEAIRNRQSNATLSAPVTSTQIQESSRANIQNIVFNKRIDKFGGFYLGRKIKLPLSDDYDEQFGNSDWVDHGEVRFRYDKKWNSIIMKDNTPSMHDRCAVTRCTSVTPKIRLVKDVTLVFAAKDKDVLMANVKAELNEAIGFPLFMDEGRFQADKGRQLLTFQAQTDNRQGDALFISFVSLVDYGSIDAEKDYVQAQKVKLQNELQRWIDDFNSRPPFTSFCGIEFGTRLTGDLERTEDGKYLCGYVKLSKPFRGCNTAKVYASVESRQIFKVELVTKDSTSDLRGILDRRYKPNGNPLINLNSHCEKCFKDPSWDQRYREGLRIENMCRNNDRLKHLDFSFSYRDYYYNLNGGHIEVTYRTVGTEIGRAPSELQSRI